MPRCPLCDHEHTADNPCAQMNECLRPATSTPGRVERPPHTLRDEHQSRRAVQMTAAAEEVETLLHIARERLARMGTDSSTVVLQVPPPAPVFDYGPGQTPRPPFHSTWRLVVIRGLKLNHEYPVYPGENYIGRTDDHPVDIDLEGQEPPDRVWSSRQHARLRLDGGQLSIEDMNSLNGTFVNRQRLAARQPRVLRADDLIQIGTVQLRVVI